MSVVKQRSASTSGGQPPSLAGEPVAPGDPTTSLPVDASRAFQEGNE